MLKISPGSSHASNCDSESTYAIVLQDVSLVFPNPIPVPSV